MIFFNRRYLTRQNFEIKTSSLKIEKTQMFDSIEYEIPFDHIHNKFTTQTAVNNNLIMVGIFFFVFSLLFQIGPNDELTLIFMFISLLFIIIPLLSRKKVITINTIDRSNVELYFTSANKHEVTEFAAAIIEAANNYLLRKLGKIDPALPIDPQIENIQYLLNREIITDEKFESLKNQLLGRDTKTTIGFGQN